MRLLIAEPDEALAAFLRKSFEAEQHTVEVAPSAASLRNMLPSGEYDVVVFDIGGSVEVLPEVRTASPGTGVLVLGTSNRVEDRVRALDLGADDYLAKPFSVAELAARARAVARRAHPGPPALLRVADLELDRLRRSVTRSGRAVELTPKEFALLELLMENAARPVPRHRILESVWRVPPGSLTNVVDVYINYLRKKMDEPFEAQLIRTIRGVGYQIGGEIRRRRTRPADSPA